MLRLLTLSLTFLLTYACHDQIQREEEDPSRGFVQERSEKARENKKVNFEGTTESRLEK